MIHQLAVGDAAAVAEIVERARSSDDVTTLVAAALFTPDSTDLLRRAAALATTSRARQSVAIAAAYLSGDRDRVEVLARDHLVDHPDSVLVAWIATAAQHVSPNAKDQ